MKRTRLSKVALAVWLAAASVTPALADTYPVSGRWGQSAGTTKGPIDCTGTRVIAFNDEQRTDTGGGVSAYRNLSVRTDGTRTRWRIVDQFTTGQISAAKTTYTLEKIDGDRIVLDLQGGSTLKMQRCK